MVAVVTCQYLDCLYRVAPASRSTAVSCHSTSPADIVDALDAALAADAPLLLTAALAQFEAVAVLLNEREINVSGRMADGGFR